MTATFYVGDAIEVWWCEVHRATFQEATYQEEGMNDRPPPWGCWRTNGDYPGSRCRPVKRRLVPTVTPEARAKLRRDLDSMMSCHGMYGTTERVVEDICNLGVLRVEP